MSSVNSVNLCGNTGKDPEIRYLDNGNTVATFSLATSESFKDKNGEWQNNTEWHNIVAWGKLAEACNRISKGDTVFIQGKIRYRSFEDKDGNKRYTTEILANSVKCLTPKQRESSEPQEAQYGRPQSGNSTSSPLIGASKNAPTSYEVIEDDLPF